MLGLPDKAYGEAVTAIVIPDSEIKRKRDEELKPALSLEELSTWAKEKLAPYKVSFDHMIDRALLFLLINVLKVKGVVLCLWLLLVSQIPTRLMLWESLPRNAMGKVIYMICSSLGFLLPTPNISHYENGLIAISLAKHQVNKKELKIKLADQC